MSMSKRWSNDLLVRSFWVLVLSAGLFTSTARAALPEFTGLVKQYGPAVVNISTTNHVPSSEARFPNIEIPDLPDGHPLNELFRRFFGERGGVTPPGEAPGVPDDESTSLGSGFIISADGYILTNYHVINEAEEIVVRLNDRRQVVAEVIGTDQRSDLALLKIDAANLPFVKMGRSRDLEVGEWVLAIGSPFGFDHSVTAGIVSAKERSLPSENYVPFIQTDVAINPGNSGGPLFNLDGEVVGINSQIYSRTGGFMGLSFAIPIDVALEVVDQLKHKGKVSRGWLGVLIQDVDRNLAESFGMQTPQGALVAQVLENSPARDSGLKVGDIIVAFNGKPVPTSASLPPMVGRVQAGDRVNVKVIRNGSEMLVPVLIGELPDEDVQVASTPKPKASSNRLGVVVGDLSAEQRAELEVREGGVLVERVLEGAAAQVGIRAGDVILRINNLAVTDAAQFEQIVTELPTGRQLPVLIHRRNGALFLALKLDR
ncbi:MAG: DegQ family serine endoprotease [Gammaproteobacteria bacterium]|nr:DegQ family serine endoprotease [Gammaproteobacteria bacterium]